MRVRIARAEDLPAPQEARCEGDAIPAEAKEALAIAIGAVNAARVAVGEMLAGLEGVPSFVRPIIDEALAGVVEILSRLAGEASDGVPTTGVPGLPGLPAGVPLSAEVLQPVLDAVNGLLPGGSTGDPLGGALLGSR